MCSLAKGKPDLLRLNVTRCVPLPLTSTLMNSQRNRCAPNEGPSYLHEYNQVTSGLVICPSCRDKMEYLCSFGRLRSVLVIRLPFCHSQASGLNVCVLCVVHLAAIARSGGNSSFQRNSKQTLLDRCQAGRRLCNCWKPVQLGSLPIQTTGISGTIHKSEVAP